MPIKRKPKTPAQAAPEASSPLVREIFTETNEKPYERIWLGFLTTRIVVGVLLSISFGLQVLLSKQLLGISPYLSFWLALGYLAAAIAARLLIKQTALLRGFSLSWAIVIGIDVLVLSALHLLRSEGMNMLPLLLLPVLEELSPAFVSPISVRCEVPKQVEVLIARWTKVGSVLAPLLCKGFEKK